MTVLRIAQCATASWRDGFLVWDDYLRQRQFPLPQEADAILRAFVVPRTQEDTDLSANDDMVDWLMASDVLIEVGSDRDRLEQSLVTTWKPWGSAARHYHFASKTYRDTPYTPLDKDRERLSHRDSQNDPPPPMVREHPGALRIPMPPPTLTASREGMSLEEVLKSRRSTRAFLDVELMPDRLGDLLSAVAGVQLRDGVSAYADGSTFRSSPSGGARHPVDVYVYTRRVQGVPPGFYYYRGFDHELEHVAGAVSDSEMTRICGDQEWVANAAAVLFWVGDIRRSTWKYDSSRAYRVLMLDAGHLSQTTYLVATYLGLGVTYTAALRDETLEQLLRADSRSDVVIGASVLGIPSENNPGMIPGLA